jgi:glutaminyl-tRNA synthetase
MSDTAKTEGHITNFIRNRIESDLERQKYTTVRTRFPPEPNGYLHIGHAKSICLNFGLANLYGGFCHMRFDDTNPVKEDQEYVDSILDSVKWLGFDWQANLFFASDYFEPFYQCAVALIKAGDAYVDSQSAEQMRTTRGTLTKGGVDSPFRERSIEENLDLFARMRAGEFADGTHIVRAKINMASPNINMRDPAIYRIRRAHHHRTGDAWCIYPMYDYAHPISDALEHISHSVCTLEFADHRPFYDWLLNKLTGLGMLDKPQPEQIEFARLNLTHVVTSKRKLQQLVVDKHVNGWDDPRMPTIYGLRRRGFTPESIQLFCDRIGVSKADGWIEYELLEQALRDDLESRANRLMAVLKPLKLIIDNLPEGQLDTLSAPCHPQDESRGKREFGFGSQLWIDRDDFMVEPSKGFFRLFPGNKVRLKYAYVIECTGFDTDDQGQVIAVRANYFPDSKSGTPGSANYKVKGVITWVACHDAQPLECHLYDHLFAPEHPGTTDADFLTELNTDSKSVVNGFVEPSLNHANQQDQIYWQFERLGYFVRDVSFKLGDKPRATGVFNRAVSLVSKK